MARRKKRVDHDNLDRWLVSYADFVTLLFAFFVVMYSISSVNETKYKNFSDSLNSAFSKQAPADNVGVLPNDQDQLLKTLVDKRTARLGEQQRKMQDKMKNLSSDLSQVMSPLINQNLVSIYPGKRGIEININASLLFKTGEAILQPAAVEVLREVSTVLSREDLPIEVEGHTDDIPITNAQFPSNWELSSARASSVVRLMASNGVQDKRLAVVGLAANHPIVPNDSTENRAKNRRVSITVLMPDMERGITSVE